MGWKALTWSLLLSVLAVRLFLFLRLPPPAVPAFHIRLVEPSFERGFRHLPERFSTGATCLM